MSQLISILSSVICVAAPVLYGSIGEIFSERASISNLGLEGLMLIGAVTGFVVTTNTGSIAFGVLATIGVGALVGLVYALLTVTLQANQVVCGLALVTFGTGLSGTLGRGFAGTKIAAQFGKVAVPVLSDIPVIGPIFFKQDLMVYFLYFLVPLAYIYIFRTRPGLKLRALGENPGVLDAAGYNVSAMRYMYVIVGCAIVALGGAYITLAYTPSWVNEITAGKGWIAAALVIFSSWNPLYAALGALLFGGVEVIGLRLQVAGVNVSSYFINMLPYIATVIVLIFSTGNFRKGHTIAPAMLGSYYDREER